MRTLTPQTTTTTSPADRLPASLCKHIPACPTADSPDREAARVISAHPDQGWSLLCNAVIVFEDTGELLPGGQVIGPHRLTDGALPFRLEDTHALIGGVSGSGKTGALAAMLARP